MAEIGFGCVKLTHNYTERQAIRNLAVAYENGVTHFDVARLYGFGLAESILGRFIADKRDKVTVTTKIGLFPNSTILKNLLAQNLLRSSFRLIKKLPALIPVQSAANQTMLKKLDPKEALQSLRVSLKELKTDYVDYLLLHEASVNEANNPELIDFLETQREKGIVRGYGIGSFTADIFQNFSSLSHKYTILQTDNSFPDSLPVVLLQNENIKKRFYFAPLRNLHRVKWLLNNETDLARVLSDRIGFDVKNEIVSLFLLQPLVSDASGTVLFASSNNRRIEDTIKRWHSLQTTCSVQAENFEAVRNLVQTKLVQNNF